VLILCGAGDTAPGGWNRHLRVEAGEVHSIEGYRCELPDRLLPQGGWQARTQLTRILKSSPVEGNSSGDETRVIPKGLMVRERGPARLAVSTMNGSFSVSPEGMPFG